MAEPTKEDGVGEDAPEVMITLDMERLLCAIKPFMAGETHVMLAGGEHEFVVVTPQLWDYIVERLELLETIGEEMIHMGCQATGYELKVVGSELELSPAAEPEDELG